MLIDDWENFETVCLLEYIESTDTLRDMVIITYAP